MTRLLLASSSPRRREILSNLGVDLEVVPAPADEILAGLPPTRLARTNARLKARAALAGLVRSDPGRLNEMVLAVDTIVVLDQRVLCKPCDPDESLRMIEALSGRSHSVISGLHLEEVRPSGRSVTLSCRTRVQFRRLSSAEIRDYVQTGEGLDKAGAYGIQGLGGLLVERISGCYFNVVGLPLATFVRALGALGYAPSDLRAPTART